MKVLHLGDIDNEVSIIRSILTSQGYDPGVGSRLFDERLRNALMTFQSQHVGPDGLPLAADGWAGPKTWWALQNPSGKAQRAFHQLIEAVKVTGRRGDVIRHALDWWQKPTAESPDGANWGGNVSAILEHAGGPRPWCCHFVSRVWKDATGNWPLGQDHGHVLTFWNRAKREGLAFQRDAYRPKPGDFAVTLHKNARGERTGTGHIWIVVAVQNGSAIYNSVGGNEGNRVKLSSRSMDSGDVEGWVNLYGDFDEPLPDAWSGLIASRVETDSPSGLGPLATR